MADLVDVLADAFYAQAPSCCAHTLHEKTPCHPMRWRAEAAAQALLELPVPERMDLLGMQPVPTAEECEERGQNWRVQSYLNRAVVFTRDCVCSVRLCGFHGRPHEQARRPMVYEEKQP